MTETAILLVNCPDQRGIVASIGEFLYSHGANILYADQHQDSEAGVFFLCAEWSLDGFDLDREAVVRKFDPIAERFAMRWRLAYSADRLRLAIFVSKYQHCMWICSTRVYRCPALPRGLRMRREADRSDEPLGHR